MKHILFILLFFSLFAQNLTAQTFQITYEDSVILEPDPNMILITPATVKNISGSAVYTLVTKEEISVLPQHSTFFDWNINHYNPFVFETQDTTLLSPQEETSFRSLISGEGYPGTSIVRYCFVDALNPSNKTCINLQYKFGVNPTGKSISVGLANTIFVTFEPDLHLIRIKENAENIQIWNLMGQNMAMEFRNKGTERIADASSLKNGIYILKGSVKNEPFSASIWITGN